MSDKYTNIKVNKKEDSEVEITGEISAETLLSYRSKAIKELGTTINIPGFRVGHVPEKMIVDKVGEVYVLEECAELALKALVPEIVEKNTPNYIGRPNITITKLAPGNPLEFKITLAVMPEVILPDYIKIAKTEVSKQETVAEVTEKEITDVIEEVRKQRAHVEYHKTQEKESKNGTKSDTTQSTEEKTKDAHNHAAEDLEKHMPELNDEFVKSLGEFKDVADFKNKIKENLTKEKEHKAIEKKRGQLLEKLVAETKLTPPKVLIDNEINRMFAQFEQDITNLGLKVEDYLKHLKKTPEDLSKDWMPDATKRAKLNLILEEIAKKENLKPDDAAVDEELKYLTANYKDKDIDPVRARAYIEHNLRIEKVIIFLEGQK